MTTRYRVALMKKRTLMTTSELAKAHGVTRQAIAARVRRGTLVPAQVLSNGHFLFDQSQIGRS